MVAEEMKDARMFRDGMTVKERTASGTRRMTTATIMARDVRTMDTEPRRLAASVVAAMLKDAWMSRDGMMVKERTAPGMQRITTVWIMARDVRTMDTEPRRLAASVVAALLVVMAARSTEGFVR